MKTIITFLLNFIFILFSFSQEISTKFKSEEVEFKNDTIKLAGTLTLPNTQSPFPAVIMVTGSGQQNRDEELFGFKPFKIIAEYLSQNGIAVLRYDDRGAGKSTGNFAKSTTSDFSEDALAGLKYLKTRKDIDKNKIGICGHSEGGIVAPMCAAKSKDVAFIILIAGPGVDGDKIILTQLEMIGKADSMKEQALTSALRQQKMIHEAIKIDTGFGKLKVQLKNEYKLEYDSLSDNAKKSITNVDKYLEARAGQIIAAINSDWFKYFIKFDPATVLEKVKCPVLALFGEKDLQVDAKVNREAVEKILKKAGNNNFKIITFPKANHLFLEAKTGSPKEYPKMKKEFVPGFLDAIKDWLVENVVKK